ncbi:hypothetical protein BJ138DRAFT_1144969 [Hygrophoropsis aurantiaca]|uniref:Uncharacterized protein n=1 Tax=Hygrophoropsis aurantiaca TaxID=72124 RepID=A0ACB8ALK9_9AGAM|nr:hypothetical protein BJ138DRAFT_1144969 [Hygrophoropsis aurantiaca]
MLRDPFVLTASWAISSRDAMAKSLQKKQAKASSAVERKVTDFFPRKSASASSQQPSSPVKPPQTPFAMTTRSRQSAGSKIVLKPTETSVPPLRPTSHTTASKHVPSRLTRSSANVLASDRRTSLKRPHSPEHQDTISYATTVQPKTPNKRKKKFESDSESGRPEGIVYVNKAGSPIKIVRPPAKVPSTPLKSQSTTVLSVQGLNNPMVPFQISGTAFSPSSCSTRALLSTSQSDEIELILPDRNDAAIGEVNEHVQKWRQKAVVSPCSSVDKDWNNSGTAMDIDLEESSSPHNTPVDTLSPAATSPVPSEADVSAQLRVGSSPASSLFSGTSPVFTSSPSASGSQPLSMPVTPGALDTDTKTAQVIADIKAKAYAASLSSSDDNRPPLEFRELEDSDDDEFELPTSKLTDERKLLFAPQTSRDIFSSPLTSLPSSTHKTSYRLRSRNVSPRSPSTSPIRPERNTRQRKSANRLPTVLTTSNASKPHPKKAAFNPLDALLREKKAADKRGNSSAAIRRAEHAVKNQPRMLSSILDEVEGSGDHSLDFADESAAWKAIQANTSTRLFSPVGDRDEPADASDTEGVMVGTRETNILGSKAGQAINKILVNDNSNKGKAKAHDLAKVLGVPLWNEQSTENAMDVNQEDLNQDINFAFDGSSPSLALLQQLMKNNDNEQLALVLNSGAFVTLRSDEINVVVSPLFKLAVYPSESEATYSAQNALIHIWKQKSKAQLSFADVVSGLFRLGARIDTADKLGLPIHPGATVGSMNMEIRANALHRLSDLVEVAAQSDCISVEDIPNTVLSLLLVGLDTSTTNELKIQLCNAINSICQSNNLRAPDVLTGLVTKLAEYTTSLTPINKAYLLSFLSSGSGRTRFISQWLAYAILTGESVTLQNGLPPITKIIDLLSPSAGSELLFDVTSDSTDYEALGHYVSIVSTVLTDIDPYVHMERNLKRPADTSIEDSPRKSKKPMMPLELIRNALELIHGKIVDTRAAHLDRSRTKAALQRLYMRIYHQREATLKSGNRGQVSNIRTYFNPRP